MLANRIQYAVVGTALLLALNGFAQQRSSDPAAAQQRYAAEVAACNRGTLPAPSREACVRAAGLALDRALGGPPQKEAMPSANGRATVVAPVGAATTPAASKTVTTPDGRATIVLPAGRASAPR